MLTPAREQREKLLLELYQKAFPVVARYVSRRGGTLDEAKDIFQEGVIIYYEKVITASATINSTEQAYVLGIAKHLWARIYQRNGQQVPLEQVASQLAEETTEAPVPERLMRFLEKTGQKCLTLLRAFYYDKLPLTEVAQQFGYSGVRSATVQKYKCLEKVRDNIKHNALGYEDFLA